MVTHTQHSLLSNKSTLVFKEKDKKIPKKPTHTCLRIPGGRRIGHNIYLLLLSSSNSNNSFTQLYCHFFLNHVKGNLIISHKIGVSNELLYSTYLINKKGLHSTQIFFVFRNPVFMCCLKYSCANEWNKYGGEKILGTGSQNSVTSSHGLG